MARVTALQAVELKIVKAQEQVSKTKKAYDTAIANQTNWEPLCKECHDKKSGRACNHFPSFQKSVACF